MKIKNEKARKRRADKTKRHNFAVKSKQKDINNNNTQTKSNTNIT